MVVNQHPTDVLNSWKEIAAYLHRGIRTVQRWERHLNMPVHHIGKGKRSPVCANVAELRFWLSTADVSNNTKPTPAEQVPAHYSESTPIQRSRELRVTMRNLSRAVAENSVRQRRQTEQLEALLSAMRSRIRRA